MKRMLCALGLLILLTACAARVQETPGELPEDIPQEIPQTIAQEAPAQVPVVLEEEQAGPEFSPADPDPAGYVSMRVGDRFAHGGREPEEMPAAPFVEHDVFYFPLQFVAEAMGVQYAFTNGCAYLKCDGHLTQLFIDSPRFIIDGVEGRVEGARTLFREDLPLAPVDEQFTPKLRDGVVFLPVDYLPDEVRMSYNAFGAQMSFQNGEGWVAFRNDRWPPAEIDGPLSVTICPGVAEALVDGERVPLPAVPFVENGSFYFPVEAMAELMGVGYRRTGGSFFLFDGEDCVQLFLNSRQYVLNGQPGKREHMRQIYTSGGWDYVPVDDDYVPLERDGVVFLPSDFFLGDMEAFDSTCFFHMQDYSHAYPTPDMLIFKHPWVEEMGIGGFYLKHKFDDTPPELRAGLHCLGKLGEYEGEYDVYVYGGDGIYVHVARRKPGSSNPYGLDGWIIAVEVTDPAWPTPRGLRCGDMPRRAWEIYGYGPSGTGHGFYFNCPGNGPITAIGFVELKVEELYIDLDHPFPRGAPAPEWFETPAFWEP